MGTFPVSLIPRGPDKAALETAEQVGRERLKASIHRQYLCAAITGILANGIPIRTEEVLFKAEQVADLAMAVDKQVKSL